MLAQSFRLKTQELGTLALPALSVPILIRPGANMVDYNTLLALAGIMPRPSAAVAARPAEASTQDGGTNAAVAAPPDQMQQGRTEPTDAPAALNAAVAADESPGTMKIEAGQGGEVAAKIEKEEAEEKGQEEKEAAVAAPPSKADIEESGSEAADYDASEEEDASEDEKESSRSSNCSSCSGSISAPKKRKRSGSAGEREGKKKNPGRQRRGRHLQAAVAAMQRKGAAVAAAVAAMQRKGAAVAASAVPHRVARSFTFPPPQ